ncbi:hypothetical protein AWB78_04238 [Caballeronia calidae]|uniref:Uncharacterized protein n=1 Tax=Caballeronia calidae TaxID=1777139 RepID=A0A158CQ63_9BURK|nr:hypothetical protein [Caballeronia calidae]SAK84502.1 hypothetical protein AWB78_04238 [Caballeronia calidae]
MESHEQSIERVQKLVDQAERLRMRAVAVPLKDLRALLKLCQPESAQQHSAKSSRRIWLGQRIKPGMDNVPGTDDDSASAAEGGALP